LKFVDNRQLNKILSLPTCIVDNYGTGEERLSDISNKLDEFSKMLKNLKDLPLSINAIYGLSSSFRHTDTFPPLPHCFKYNAQSEKSLQIKRKDQKCLPKYPLGPVMLPYLKPLEVCIQLESSGKWPDDLSCIKRLKTAFHIKIVQLLREVYGLQGNAKVDFFDVFFKGFMFRVRVYTMSELMLVKTSVNEQGVRVARETACSLNYERVMFEMPKMVGFIQA
jgi:U3 small nucleolar RNA-associated protein 22